MSKESVEVVSEIYKALARRDLQAMLGLIDSKTVGCQSEYLGFEGIQQFFTRLFGTIDSQLAVEEFVDVGDKVIVIGSSRGKVRATGAMLSLRAVHVWTVNGNRAVRFESSHRHAEDAGSSGAGAVIESPSEYWKNRSAMRFRRPH